MHSTIYHFRSSIIPSEKHLHCLWNTLTDKAFNQKNVDFKIIPNGKLVAVITNIPLPKSDVQLRDTTFTFVRESQVAATSYTPGQVVHAQGNLCYSVHHQKDGKSWDVCPVELDGSIRKELCSHFLAYMSRATGLDFEEAFKEGHLNFSRENRSCLADKVHLNDIIVFDLTASVQDVEKVNTLPMSGIGRRKSYGFGHVLINNS